MFATTVDSAGANHHCFDQFSLKYWNTYTSRNVPTAYAVALAKPIRIATLSGAPSASTTAMLPIIANGYAAAIVARAIFLPNIRTVKSVASTTNGNVNAAQVNLILAISTGMLTKAFEIVITTTCKNASLIIILLSMFLNIVY